MNVTDEEFIKNLAESGAKIHSQSGTETGFDFSGSVKVEPISVAKRQKLIKILLGKFGENMDQANEYLDKIEEYSLDKKEKKLRKNSK